jgi:hypothetical protein
MQPRTPLALNEHRHTQAVNQSIWLCIRSSSVPLTRSLADLRRHQPLSTVGEQVAFQHASGAASPIPDLDAVTDLPPSVQVSGVFLGRVQNSPCPVLPADPRQLQVRQFLSWLTSRSK